MKMFVLALLLGAVFALTGIASADTLHLVSPIELDPSATKVLGTIDKAKIRAAFARIAATPEVKSGAPSQALAKFVAHPEAIVVRLPNATKAFITKFPSSDITVAHKAAIETITANGGSTAYITDPVTGAMFNVDALVAESIAVQQAWFKKTGHNLSTDEPLDLNILTSTPPASGTFAQTATRQPEFSRTADATSSSCPAPASPDDLSAAWTATTAFLGSPSDTNICALPYGGFIQQVDKTGTPLRPLGSSFTQQFGDPKTAQGTFSVSADLTQPSGDLFKAAFDVKFSALFLNGKIAPAQTILDGAATLEQPSSGDATATVDITGVAFPQDSLFSTTQKVLDGKGFNYTGTPSKSYTFVSFNQSFPIGVVTIATSGSITGTTGLKYTILGGPSGLFAQATPSVIAKASATASAKLFVLTGVSTTGDVTVQNSKSTFSALATIIPYDKQSFAVERVQAVYSPFTYEADLTVTGYVPFLFKHFTAKLIDTGAKPIGVGPFTGDTNWSVQRVLNSAKGS